ncbi:carotenoid biosynthesis protein [Nonomuraea pusilla]|uniref:Putative membrane protein n=1 Tax=Nonomuraea pusilla TaxID=46177 RepID=A0A1H7WTD4_9ACTN|nr:carotenoid biosynthesis protein [Nonomuraea pusilla]SEM24826.1 putative membrane protein [Nonomuraea pusilla]
MDDTRSACGRAPGGSEAVFRQGSASALGPSLGAAAVCAMVALQVASGVSADPVPFTTPVVGLLALAAVCLTAASYGWARSSAAFAAAALTGYAAEFAGVRTGLPFGEYRYTGVLRPELAGVPTAVAAAWGGMGLAAYAVGRAAFGQGAASPPRAASRRGRFLRSGWPALAGGACALTAWDLFLDPQMIRLGLWEWSGAGAYRGVPVSNFAGWLAVSLLVMAVIRGVLGEPRRNAGPVVPYGVMAAMETVGFAAVFSPPDPLVAAAGGTAMGAFTVAAASRLRRGGRERGARGEAAAARRTGPERVRGRRRG